MTHKFSDLPYAYDALEPYIDAKTMEVHHSKHHKAYYDKFIAAIEGTDLVSKSLSDIFAKISTYSPAVRNNGGGYFNHDLFWNSMGPNCGGAPTGTLSKAINDTFGSLDKFKEQFTQSAITTFGSGFVWLVVKDGKLVISSTPNQDNPLMDIAAVQGTPIMALDVWEHAYYLNYQNRRPDYIDAWWNVVDWASIAKRYDEAMS